MRGYVPTLDGWRAIAIVMVLTYHATACVFYPGDLSEPQQVGQTVAPPGTHPNAIAYKVSELGMRGVHLFFAISGFIITVRLLQEEQSQGHVSLRGFYLRRACRILPLYVLYLSVLAGLQANHLVEVHSWEWRGCLLFFRNYLPDPAATDGWYTRHFWSLSLEEHFYLTWPVLFVLAGRKYRTAALIASALCVFGWRTAVEHLHLVSTHGYWSRRSDIRMDGLLWGCYAALLYSHPATHAWLRRWLTPWTWLAVIAVFLAVVSGRLPGTGFLYPFLIPWILVATAVHPEWRLSQWMETSPVRWVGRLSYSLYVWQQIFLFGDVKTPRPFPLGWLQELPGSLLATFAVSVVSYYLVEKPLTRWGHQLSAGRNRTKLPTAADNASLRRPAADPGDAIAGL